MLHQPIDRWTMSPEQRATIDAQWQSQREPVVDRFLTQYPQFSGARDALLVAADHTHTGLITAFAERAPCRRQFEAMAASAPAEQRRALHEASTAAEQAINIAVRDGRCAMRQALGFPAEFEPGYDPLEDPALQCMKPVIGNAIKNFRDTCGTHVIVDAKYWGSKPEACVMR